jgi:hypothetical protein
MMRLRGPCGRSPTPNLSRSPDRVVEQGCWSSNPTIRIVMTVVIWTALV